MDECSSPEGHEWRVSIEGSYPDLEIYAYCKNNDPNARKTCYLSQGEIEAILNAHASLQQEIERLREPLPIIASIFRQLGTTIDPLISDDERRAVTDLFVLLTGGE